ncbi:uncharacterized protein N7459_007008 [Penicillium hispanicum]|uniref:uncharacterized protein n=1 Tax=Penicillium hispanicum TaxID=1080232 RepID=UPI002541204F|nr:uncharacterized protein N7459_007008 [Penicillium hispanicum]KAJ5578044.1 hypothetical protein N7459_007008 [Penicillium hispanicum]
MSYPGKRIILCLDGTWVNSDKGYDSPTLSQPNETLQIPTNVTRVYRALRKRDPDGKGQVLYYHPGVGSSGTLADTIAGGAFGVGVSENIREAYSFVAVNYEPGDEIILVGFSRGAFTARSVAGLITQIGLLTADGLEALYPIFKDVQNWKNPHYRDKFPKTPFPDKPKTPNHGKEYTRRLEEEGLTRLYDPDGYRIKVRCVAVWETFYDTSLSNKIDYAFQALALDEDRTSFAPTLWERPRHVRTHLRQVWFPGAHSNVGGGLPDQEIANLSMAWMMDQLASIGIAFEDGTIDKIFRDSVFYYFDHAHHARSTSGHSKHKPRTEWAMASIYDEHKPVRPWALGEIIQPDTGLYRAAGKTTRTPGMYHRIDPETALDTPYFLEDTHESIHRSVRLRLALEGLGYDDTGPYKCRALLKKGPWEVRRMRVVSRNHVQDSYGEADEIVEDHRWGWVYIGPEEDAPPVTVLMEEPLGPYEKKLLGLNKGEPSPSNDMWESLSNN